MHDVSELFARQDSLATTAQLAALGVSPGRIRQRLASGEWRRHAPSVLGLTAVTDNWHRRVRAALLSAGPDAAASGATAGRLHRFDGFDEFDGIELTTCGLTHHMPIAGVSIKRSRMLKVKDCLLVGGLLCVSRPIALVQIAGSGDRQAAAKALDGMLRSGNNPIWIKKIADEWNRPGVSGARVVLELLHERVDARLPRSWFQRLAKEVLQSHGMVLDDEYPVRVDRTLLAELDLAIPELQIGIECQSWAWHSTPTARAKDARRRRRLRLLGWELVEVWWSDLERIGEIVAEIQFLVDRRLARNPVA